MLNPFQEQEAQYNLLLSLQSELLSFIKDGVVARDVYHHALSFVKQKDPTLERHFAKNIGFGVGIACVRV
jgi:nucleosome binding factor SPN SPT16 subunit